MDDGFNQHETGGIGFGLEDSDGNAISMWWQDVKLWEEIELVH